MEDIADNESFGIGFGMNNEYLYERFRIDDRRGGKNKAILRTTTIQGRGLELVGVASLLNFVLD